MKAEERRDVYKSVLDNPQGKLILADLEKQCSFNQSSFNSDPLIMAKREGHKDLFRYIKKQLEAK